MPHFDTSLNVLNNTALELGLIESALSNPFTSTDQNIIQLRTLLTRVGRMLVRAHPWTHLVEEHSFNTVASTESYALPAGFERFLNATAWNRDTSWPLAGPFTPAQWQAVQTRTALGTVVRPFRITQNLLYLFPVPTAAEEVAFEYVSRYWVMENGQTAPNADIADAAADTVWFDEPMVVAALKLAFTRAKQRDTTYAQAEFDECFRAAAGGDGGAPIIQIASASGLRLLGEDNLPDSGWGV